MKIINDKIIKNIVGRTLKERSDKPYKKLKDYRKYARYEIIYFVIKKGVDVFSNAKVFK
jgi:hypothetical protein